ncbi:hypothetical protein LP421_00325 (plasmid) [Rhizobium sp. RCAM05350]|nr:hypothetical protein LP421_00325 [Rhizobium sp. RCAM05350]
MRGDATRIVGLLLPNLVNEFYAQFADTMARACEEQALHLVIHLTNDDEINERQAILRLREVQASAVVMVPTPVADSDEPATIEGMRVVQLIRRRDLAPALLIDDASSDCRCCRSSGWPRTPEHWFYWCQPAAVFGT